MPSKRFIFIDSAAEKLYVSPELRDVQGDCSVESGSGPDSRGLPHQGLAEMFRVRDVVSFRKACEKALEYFQPPLDAGAGAVEELTLKDVRVPQADERIFILNGGMFSGPAGWDGTAVSLYEYINQTVQIALALKTPSKMQGSEALTYSCVLKIPSQELARIDGFLNAQTEDEYQGEDHTIIHTARFPDGKEMDIKCCGCRKDPSWTEAVLFDAHGFELVCSGVCEEYTGLWELECGGVTYAVSVIAADGGGCTAAEKPSHADREGICPVCGSILEDYDAHEILDEGGVIPWTCRNCGATGKEGYDRVFDRHYNVCLANGDPAPGREE